MLNHYFVHSSIAIFRLMGLLAFIVYKIIIIIIIIIIYSQSYVWTWIGVADTIAGFVRFMESA